MLITFDSNVARIVPRIINQCNAKTFRWCLSDCECLAAPKNKTNETTILYDTPIALCEALDLPNDIDLHFIYIDFNEWNSSFDRIMKNIKTLKSRYVVIGNDANKINGLSYVLQTMNIPISVIANVVTLIINSYIESGTLQHPKDIITKNYGANTITNTMKYDMFAQFRSEESQIDCERCKRGVQ